MSAIALLLARMGHRVSGSDIKDATVLTGLRAAGVDVRIGNRPEHVPEDADAVVYSTAVPLGNRSWSRPARAGILVLHRAGVLRAIVATRDTIAVAGSHGKTTTSSMLALILRQAGWNPSFLIGGELNEVGTNAAYGDGPWLVVEADESDGTFLQIAPDGRDHHQRRARPSRPLRRVRRARARVRTLRRRGSGPGGLRHRRHGRRLDRREPAAGLHLR